MHAMNAVTSRNNIEDNVVTDALLITSGIYENMKNISFRFSFTFQIIIKTTSNFLFISCYWNYNKRHNIGFSCNLDAVLILFSSIYSRACSQLVRKTLHPNDHCPYRLHRFFLDTVNNWEERKKAHKSGCNGGMGKSHWIMDELSLLRPRKWAVGGETGQGQGMRKSSHSSNMKKLHSIQRLKL